MPMNPFNFSAPVSIYPGATSYRSYWSAFSYAASLELMPATYRDNLGLRGEK